MAARVDSIEVLRELRVAVWKFAEAATQILTDVESHMQRTLVWLETEQQHYWQGQIRMRGQAVTQAKEAVRAKKFLRGDARPSDIDEQKALRLAQTRLEEANTKLANVRRWALKLQKEILVYKGQVNRFANFLGNELPTAAAKLDYMAAKLDEYVSLAPGSEAGAEQAAVVAGESAGEALPSFKRPEPVEVAPQAGTDVSATPEPGSAPAAEPAREEDGHGRV